MPIAIENPLALVLLLVLPAIYFVGRGRLSLMRPWRARSILGLRSASMAAAILALAGPSMPANDGSMSVAFVVDHSPSVSATTRSRQEDWIRQSLSQMKSSDRAAIVTFAGEPRVVRPLSGEKDPRLAPEGDLKPGTDIAAALRLASGLLPSSGLKRVVLLSDGWDTSGQAEAAARSLPAGTRLDVVPLPAMDGQPEVLIESLEIPSYVRQGDSFDVSAVVGSSLAETAQLAVLVDGQPTGNWSVQLGAGANLVTLAQKALPLGFHSITVRLTASNDTVAANNSTSGFVVVKQKGRVLMVEGKIGSGSVLKQELEGSGLAVDRLLVSEFPIQMSKLLNYDAVVLDDVSATNMSLDQMKTLDSYVKDQGRGLLVMGGTQSYGLGDYVSGPLESMLPVSSNVPLSRERGDMALVLVIDKSGSMDDSFQGVTKIDMAREAAIQATETLKPDDQIGIFAFDIDPQWIVPTRKVGNNLAEIRNRISMLRASGGTDIYSALLAAYNSLRNVRATQKHITLLTDGQSWRGQYQTLIQKMRQDRITLSTVAIGSDADKQWLSEMARLGDGRYYFTERFVDIPKIVYREVSLATRVAEVQGKIAPLFVSPSPILRGINLDNMPPLTGYVATQPKDAATIVLKTARGDPLLAQWQYGLGRVAAWTSDAEGLWTSDWVLRPQYSRIWDQAVRWTMAPPIDRGLQLSVAVNGNQATISADSVDHNGHFINLADTRAQVQSPDGSRVMVPLQQTAPGRYQATVPSSKPGLYRVDVYQVRQGQPASSETTGFSVPGSAEFLMLGSNDSLLKELASTTGGRAIQDPAAAFGRQGMPSTPGWEPLWPYLLGMALLLLPLEIAIRRIRALPFTRQTDDDLDREPPAVPDAAAARDEQRIAA